MKCACGCGKSIVNQSHHKYYGTPKYIKGHNSKSEEFKIKYLNYDKNNKKVNKIKHRLRESMEWKK